MAVPSNIPIPMPMQRPQMMAQPPGGPLSGMMQRFGGLGSGIRNNADLLLLTGLGLISGQTGQQQAAMGAQGFMQGKQLKSQKADRNKTLQYLQQNDPELAAAVEAGMDPSKAFELSYTRKAQKGQNPYMNVGEGRLFNWQTGEFTTAPQGEMAGVDEDAFKRTRDVRNDYFKDADVKTYGDVRNAYERVRASAVENSGPGDIGLIFNYMKMLDPASVVREGEFATAESAGGVGQQIRNLYNKALTGERLTPEVRNQIVSLAESLYNETASNLSSVNDRYGRVGEDWQVDADRFIMQPEQYPPLKIGESRDVPTSGGKITIKRMPD